MKVTISNQADGTVQANIEGRITTAVATQFSDDMAPLMEQADKHIVLNMAELEFISSSGLRILLTLRKATMKAGGSVTIKAASPEIQQVFQITGFVALFDMQN